MALGWIIDPGAAQFDLNDLASTFVRGQSLPMPAPRAQYVTAVDVDGDTLYSQNYGNRTITLVVEVKGTTATTLETAMGHLHQKIAAINREAVLSRTGIGGALQYTSPSTKAVTFDVCSVSASPELAETYFFGNLVTVTLTFECKPEWHEAEVTFGDHVETTLPWLTFTETGITGDLPARARFRVDEDQAVDQRWLIWGIRSRYYDSSADAALAYQAETRSRLGASTTAGTSGASAGIAVRSGALGTTYLAALSTQATGGGNHLRHVGEYRIIARVQSPTANTGTVSVALEWGEGDFRRFSRNPSVELSSDHEGAWLLADLGQVTLSAVAAGTQRWEGRVLAKSTVAGDKVDVDWLMIVPTLEGSGVVEGLTLTAAPTGYSGFDDFAQSAGNLNGKTAPTGGNWATSGATTDFATTGSGAVTRSVGTDTTTPRLAVLGSTTLAGVVAQVDVTFASNVSGVAHSGLLLRYVDASNYAAAYIYDSSTGSGNFLADAAVVVVVGGTATTYSTATSFAGTKGAYGPRTLRTQINPDGAFQVFVGTVDAEPTAVLSGSDTNLATGATLATGKFGLYDLSSAAYTRTYDNFTVSAPVLDAAVFASQSIEIRHDRVIREDSGGTLWVTPSSYVGDYMTVPPAGLEGRTIEVIVKMSRGGTGGAYPDSAIDDLSGQLFVTPLGLGLPE